MSTAMSVGVGAKINPDYNCINIQQDRINIQTLEGEISFDKSLFNQETLMRINRVVINGVTFVREADYDYKTNR